MVLHSSCLGQVNGTSPATLVNGSVSKGLQRLLGRCEVSEVVTRAWQRLKHLAENPPQQVATVAVNDFVLGHACMHAEVSYPPAFLKIHCNVGTWEKHKDRL